MWLNTKVLRQMKLKPVKTILNISKKITTKVKITAQTTLMITSGYKMPGLGHLIISIPFMILSMTLSSIRDLASMIPSCVAFTDQDSTASAGGRDSASGCHLAVPFIGTGGIDGTVGTDFMIPFSMTHLTIPFSMIRFSDLLCSMEVS